ncbi:MAG: hypothetical protein K2L13_01890 [Opitutales bacterium]|nr:hypothetical protein [Opitutales bacterium]
MNTLNLFDTDNWKSLSKKPLLYVGFYEESGTNYVVISTRDKLMFVQECQTPGIAIKNLPNFTNGSPVIFNQLKTKTFWDSYKSAQTVN